MQSDTIRYWLRGQTVQNYGDFLSELLVDRLATGTPSGWLRVIGSCLSDKFVPEEAETDEPIVFWGCGARDESGMSDFALSRVEVLSVRGPLTRKALRLGDHVPVGDPALLLPLMHEARSNEAVAGRALLIPHFIEMRSDTELLSISGCDAVLRPNVGNWSEALVDFIDQVASARFVLAGSLHGAITACAYGVPFAFWESGNIDTPFKWHDFAASIGIPCAFHAALTDAEDWFAREAANAIVIPPLSPMLAAAPFCVDPGIVAATIQADIARHGSVALESAGVLRKGTLVMTARRELHVGLKPASLPFPIGDTSPEQLFHAVRRLRVLLDDVQTRLEVAEMRAAREAGGRLIAEARVAKDAAALASPEGAGTKRASRAWSWLRRSRKPRR